MNSTTTRLVPLVALGALFLKAVRPFVKSMGDACKSCHDGYRKPKEESYKNK